MQTLPSLSRLDRGGVSPWHQRSRAVWTTGGSSVYLVTQPLLPWSRSCEVLGDLLGVQVSEGTLAGLIRRTAEHLVPVEAQIKAALRHAHVIHQDETGLYVANRPLLDA